MFVGLEKRINFIKGCLSGDADVLNKMSQKFANFFRFPNHTPERFINKAVVQISKQLAWPKAYGVPSHVIIEISSACQLKCPLCPVGNGSLNRPSHIMSFDTFKAVIDEIAGYVYRVNLSGMGEPTLNHQIVEMIEYAKRKNIYVDLYTNFQLKSQKLIESFVDVGLDSILIALDGATKETYEQYRIGGKFEGIIDNIRCLVETRKQSGGKKPEINIQFIAFDHNKDQLSMISDLVRSLGADNLYVKRPFLFWGTEDKEENYNYIKNEDDFNAYKVGGNGATWKLKPKKVCDYLWAATVVLADGSISPCCFDYDGKVVFGNVKEEPFKKIWNNNKYRSFRKQNRTDWKSVPLCHQDFEGGCPNMYVQSDDWLIKL
ncbi:MAG: SPASM domain-containing protein [Nitrospinales bacterium]